MCNLLQIHGILHAKIVDCLMNLTDINELSLLLLLIFKKCQYQLQNKYIRKSHCL